MAKKTLSLALATVLMLGLRSATPPTALAAEISTPGLSAGANLSGTQVYFGSYAEGSRAGPILWYVVETGSGTATLWTVTNMTDRAFDTWQYDASNHQDWSGSDICARLNGTDSYSATGFLPTAISTAEQAAIVPAYGTANELMT